MLNISNKLELILNDIKNRNFICRKLTISNCSFFDQKTLHKKPVESTIHPLISARNSFCVIKEKHVNKLPPNFTQTIMSSPNNTNHTILTSRIASDLKNSSKYNTKFIDKIKKKDSFLQTLFQNYPNRNNEINQQTKHKKNLDIKFSSKIKSNYEQYQRDKLWKLKSNPKASEIFKKKLI